MSSLCHHYDPLPESCFLTHPVFINKESIELVIEPKPRTRNTKLVSLTILCGVRHILKVVIIILKVGLSTNINCYGDNIPPQKTQTFSNL